MTEMMTWDFSKSAGAIVYHPHLYAGLFRNHQDAVADAVGKHIENAPDEGALDKYMRAIRAVPDTEAKMTMVFAAAHRAEQLGIAAERAVRWGWLTYGRGAFGGNGEEHYGGIIRTIDKVRTLCSTEKATAYLDDVLDQWKAALRRELAAMLKHDEEMELER